jgi:flagellar hook-basal body complex protein FliE
MSPLSAIPQSAMHAYGIKPRVDIASEGVTPLPGLDKVGAGSIKPTGDSFSTMLGNFVADVNAKQNVAADAVTRLQSGGDVSLHQAVISMEEANVSFQLMVEVRNKLLESYQELMRMQI